jgi:GDP-4-dehydro-6-deoxy-D-mannose reductase
MKVLITGATGFAGRHLAKALPPSKYTVIGTCFPLPPRGPEKSVFFLDLRSERDVYDAVRTVQPQWIIHLAAVSNVRHSWDRRKETMETNVMGTFYLLEAVKKYAPGARFLFVSSADVYGAPASGGGGKDGRPLAEGEPVLAVNPYGLSKLAGELLSGFTGRVEGLDVVIARPFTHTGPGQPPDFVCSDWARQIVRIERGAQESVIKTGNLDVRRDFTDVRDVVQAYILLLQKGERGEAYNICRGEAVPLRRILDLLLSLSSRVIDVQLDPGKLRPADIPDLAGDNGKIRRATGWQPMIPLEQTLRDLLDYWRAHP